MKESLRLLFILIALIVVTPIQSQSFKMNYGVKGGIDFTTISHPVNNKPGKFNEKSTGFFIGPMAELSLPIKGMGVNCSLMYFERDYSNVKEQGVEIPVNLKYILKLGTSVDLYGEIGTTFYVNCNAKKTDIILELDNSTYMTLLNAETQNRQLDFNLGAGIILFEHLQVGVSYQIPTKECYICNIGEQNTIDAKIRSWKLILSYLL